jgi:hypothetical protein
MTPDLTIAPVGPAFRWLRSGPSLWWQRLRADGAWQGLAGWRFPTRGLAVAMFRRLVPAEEPAHAEEASPAVLTTAEMRQLKKLLGNDGAALVLARGTLDGKPIEYREGIR